MFVKELRPGDDVVLYGKWGPVRISLGAIEDLVRKTVRKFEIVRAIKVKTDVEGSHLKIVANISVSAGWNVQEVIDTIQKEMGVRVQKMMGGDIDLEVTIHVIKIISEPVPA